MKTKLVIFGITGDLSTRKLLPALEHIIGTQDYQDVSIVGVSRRDVDVADLLQSATGSTALVDRTTVFTMDLAVADDYGRLKDYLALGDDQQAVIYLSVPPSAAADIVDLLGKAGLNTGNVKLLFEKPFGFDLFSAQDFIDRTKRYFDEQQLYRIDHYMAKEIAADILTLRSNAENHHRSWGAHSIASVDIVASEKIGIEGRTTFYEQTGALRDFIQGHLMQLLSLVLMDIPADFDIAGLPTYRLEALLQLWPADPRLATRSQYIGYQEEVENKGSQTETFVSMDLSSSDPHWQGVKLRLVTGKALSEKRSFITVHYNDGTQDVFEEGAVRAGDNRLPDAYERVLIEAIAGNKALFTSSDEVIRSWEIVRPVQQVWEMNQKAIAQYQQGSVWSDVAKH